MPRMTDTQMQAFFQRTRHGILLSNGADGRPHGVPVWFDWDGEVVQFFSGAGAPKVERLAADPRMAMLVVNDIDEAPAWVRFEGRAVFDLDADARSLAVDVLAPRYWDLDDPSNAATVEAWSRADPQDFVVIRLRPDHIASSI